MSQSEPNFVAVAVGFFLFGVMIGQMVGWWGLYTLAHSIRGGLFGVERLAGHLHSLRVVNRFHIYL